MSETIRCETIELGQGITVIDAQFVKPGFASSHLIIENGKAAFIDTGTFYSVPIFLEVLDQKGIHVNDVEFVILTHIHLDHAGGAGALMEKCPNAKLIVHPRGSRHMIHPEKLIAGTYAVFGEETSKKLYGRITGIPQERVIATTDEMKLNLNGRELFIIDAPGHAKHHCCIWDKKSEGLFTGDAFGLSYRVFDTDKGEFILPTTTPIHFDPRAMRETINRCMTFKPKAVYPTHFGIIRNIPAKAEQLLFLLDEFIKIIEKHGDSSSERHELVKKAMGDLLFEELRKHGVTLTYQQCREHLEKDLELNAQGLAFWWDHCRE